MFSYDNFGSRPIGGLMPKIRGVLAEWHIPDTTGALSSWLAIQGIEAMSDTCEAFTKHVDEGPQEEQVLNVAQTFFVTTNAA